MMNTSNNTPALAGENSKRFGVNLPFYFMEERLFKSIMLINLSNLDNLAIELDDATLNKLYTAFLNIKVYDVRMTDMLFSRLTPIIYQELADVLGVDRNVFFDYLPFLLSAIFGGFYFHTNGFDSEEHFHQTVIDAIDKFGKKHDCFSAEMDGKCYFLPSTNVELCKALYKFYNYLLEYKSEVFVGVADEFLDIFNDKERLASSLKSNLSDEVKMQIMGIKLFQD